MSTAALSQRANSSSDFGSSSSVAVPDPADWCSELAARSCSSAEAAKSALPGNVIEPVDFSVPLVAVTIAEPVV